MNIAFDNNAYHDDEETFEKRPPVDVRHDKRETAEGALTRTSQDSRYPIDTWRDSRTPADGSTASPAAADVNGTDEFPLTSWLDRRYRRKETFQPRKKDAYCSNCRSSSFLDDLYFCGNCRITFCARCSTSGRFGCPRCQ